MGDTDALRDKIAQLIHGQRCLSPEDCIGGVNDDYRLADAVLPVVTQETAQALSLLRSRVEALADELDNEAARDDTALPLDATPEIERDEALRYAARRLRSLSDNKEQQQ